MVQRSIPCWNNGPVITTNEPRRGPPESLMERLQSYLHPVDPAFGERCVPARVRSIERYAALAGFDGGDTLPRGFRCFLEAMGKKDGGLLSKRGIDAELDSMIQMYEDCLKTEPESLNPHLPVVAAFLVGGEISLDLRAPSDDPAVVESSEGSYAGALAHSWEWFLMQAAMEWVVPRLYSYGWVYSASAREVEGARSLRGGASPRDAIDDFRCANDLAYAWASDENHRILRDGQSVIFVDIRRRGSVLIRAFARDESFCRVVAARMARSLGATSEGPSVLRSRGE